MLKSLKNLNFDRKTLTKFLIIAFGSQIIYSIWTLKGPLYNPFIETMGITNAQLGYLFTIMGLVGTSTCIIGGTIMDRFPINKVLAFDLVLTGILGFIVASRPSFSVLLVVFALLGLSTDGFYWYGVLKSVRVIASDDRQGTAFGTLELVRGVTDISLATIGVFIFTILGQKLFGITVAIMVNSALIILMGILTWIFIPTEDFLKTELHAEKSSEKNKLAIKGLLKVLVLPEVWLVGLQASGVYLMYIGMQYFVPFLQGVYSIPVLFVAVFGIVNTSGMRMVASPLGGLIGDKKFGSSTKLMRVLLIAVSIFLGIILFLPKKSAFMVPSILSLILITVSIYMLRGVYYAPIGELKISKAMSGAAMAVAGFIGYSPQFWAYSLFGTLIDKYEPVVAYSKIFSIMFGFSIFGIISSMILCKKIEKKKLQESEKTA